MKHLRAGTFLIDKGLAFLRPAANNDFRAPELNEI